jgi:hypothetical protein
MKAKRERMLELMLFEEAGGIGYSLAIAGLAQDDLEYYQQLLLKINGIKKDLEVE